MEVEEEEEVKIVDDSSDHVQPASPLTVVVTCVTSTKCTLSTKATAFSIDALICDHASGMTIKLFYSLSSSSKTVTKETLMPPLVISSVGWAK